MAITLADVQKNAQDDIQKGVIDEFRKSNWLMENLTFDDAVNPSGGGATLTYGYQRVITERGADFREFNKEYTAQEAKKQGYNVNLRPFGGTFEIDRVLAKSKGLVDEIEFQVQQLTKATSAFFNDVFINGDVATNANGIDGINKAVTGSSTEYNNDAVIDLSSEAQLEANKHRFIDMLDEFLGGLDGEPTALLGNTKVINKIKALARRAGYMTHSEDAFGRKVDGYGNVKLVDLGAKAGSASPVIPVVERTVGTAQTGLADLYAVRLGMDGVHGVTLAGEQMMNIWLPDFTTAGAVKTGEAELVGAIAVKATKSAGVFRNIKVQ